MVKQLILSTFSLLVTTIAFAQMPQSITFEGSAGLPTGERMACPDQNTGDIDLQNFQGQSNDTGNPAMIFLCQGDTFDAVQVGTPDLSGDPDMTSSAGITYTFYSGMPTVAGNSLAEVFADPAIIPDPEGLADAPILVIGTGNINGDVTFFNNGGLQNSTVLGGTGAPVQLWFAPITIDDFASRAYENDENGGPTGPCVKVGINDALSVVYLNELSANNKTINGCQGSFTISGGLPEFDNSNYDNNNITIELASNPSITGSVSSGSVSHGGQINFSVPVGGTYNITIEDDKSCGTTFQMTFEDIPPLELSASTETVQAGSTVCVDIIAEANFTDIISMQMTIQYDETVTQFASFNNFNPNLIALSSSVNNTISNNVVISWLDPGISGVTLADNSVIMQICFNVIGTGGDVSPIVINGAEVPIEIANECGQNSNNGNNVALSPTAGSVTIATGAFAVDIDPTDETCDNLNNGSFDVNVSGGQAPYTVNWASVDAGVTGGPALINTTPGSFTANNLEPGAYSITTTDNTGAEVIENVTINNGLNIVVNIDETYPTCPGDCDGSLSAVLFVDGILVTNPGPEYVFTWSNGSPAQSLTNLCGDGVNYGVTVTGPNGCGNSASSALGGANPIAINETVTNAYCNGMNDGQIVLNLTGGAPNYQVDWVIPDFPPQPTITNLTGLGPGIKEVMITDANGCSQTFNIVVGATKIINLDTTVVRLSCFDDTDASISVTASASGAPASSFTFNWFGAPPPPAPTTSGATSTISNLAAGTYTVTATDNEGCQSSNQDGTFIIGNPTELMITIDNLSNESCPVGGDGSATLSVTGGSTPYTYNWGISGQTTETATGLSADTYTVTVTDDNQCAKTIDVTIASPQPPTITVNDSSVNCFNSTDGSLTVNYTAGSAAVTGVVWSNNATTETIDNLAPGMYSVTVNAADGCSTVETAEVTAPTPIAVDNVQTAPTNCPGQGGGFANVIVSGGTTPYTFSWSPNTAATSNTNPLSGGDVYAGTYSVTINDANNCGAIVEDNIVIPEPPAILADFTAIDSVSCFNSAGVPPDGEATITPYYEGQPNNTMQQWNISWQTIENNPLDVVTYHTDNGVLVSSANNLPQGEQFIVVSDGQCADTFAVVIPTPDALLAIGQATPVSCNGDTDGSVTVTGQGGTAPYTYNWSTGDVNVTTVENLAPGDVTVQVSDAKGCNFTLAAEVGEPDEFMGVLLPETKDSVTCNGGNDAIISLSTVGGNPGNLTYNWQDGIANSNESIATDVGSGNWGVTITDSKGCKYETSVLITEPSPITFEYSYDSIACYGYTTPFQIDTVMGGRVTEYLDYEYRFNITPPNRTISIYQPFNLHAGSYTVSVFDREGCEVSETFTLTEPNELLVELPDLIEIELGDTTTQLNPIIFNDFPLDSLIWTPSEGLSSDTIPNPYIRNSTSDITYTLIVVDANGCVGGDDVRVEIDRNRNIYIPNAFSPNNDGVNDAFGVFGCRGVEKILSGRVFDRWGELVAELPLTGVAPECNSPNGAVIWDGTFRGKRAADGVYVYYVEVLFLDGVKLIYRGDVTIMK